MKRKHLIFPILLFMATGNFAGAQTELPYYTGFDNSSQQEGWEEFRLGAQSEFYMWEISEFSAFSQPNNLVHTYPVGGTETTDDWFVSPGFDMPDGGTIDSLRYAFSGFGVPAESDTIAVYLLTGSQDPELASSRELLMDFRGEDYMSDNTWRLLSDLEIPASEETVYIGFRYFTVVNWLDVRYDNLRVDSNTINKVEDPAEGQQNIAVYPNPTSDRLHFDFQNNNESRQFLKIYDEVGRFVLEEPLFNHTSIPVNLESGAYFYQILDDEGKMIQKGKFVVQ